MTPRHLAGFVRAISREHPAVVYGDHTQALRTVAPLLGLNLQVF